jgi:multimeric flavodoxin WrbA
MINNPIIVLGSSRSYGETRAAVEMILGGSFLPIVDLKNLNITPYDYDHKNQNDDYLSLIARLTDHNLIVLATPVYWYTMSSIMKIFIDRLSDILELRKDLGRQLRNKNLLVIASYNTSLPRGFEDQFEQTCHYLGIKYRGCSFIYHGEDQTLKQCNDAAIIKARRIIFEDDT